MDPRPFRRALAARRGWTLFATIAVVASACMVVAMAPPAPVHSRGGVLQAGLRASSPTKSAAPGARTGVAARAEPLFSAGVAGQVTRTVFPGFNTSIPGSFTSSVATWIVGTPAYVPTTNSVWFPQRAQSVAGDPIPTLAPAAVFNLSTGSFDRLVTNLSNASALAYDPGNGGVYATLPASNEVVLVNPRTGALVGAPIPVGSSPNALTLDPNSNELYVANSGSANVTVINTLLERVSIRSLPVGSDPDSLVFDPLDNLVFVANAASKIVSVINTTNPTVSLLPITLIYGPASALAYSIETDTVVASVPSSPFATVIGASVPAAITEDAPVGTGVDPVTASANGTEFLLGNSSGANIVVLNSATGYVVDPSLPTQQGPAEFAVDPVTKSAYCWASHNRVLESVNISAKSVEPLTSTAYPELASESYSSDLARVYVAATNQSSVYSLSPTTLNQQSALVPISASPFSVASDPAANRFFVGTNNGVAVYNALTGSYSGSIGTLTGNCTQLVVDRADNLLWLSNTNLGVVGVNLTNLHVVITTIPLTLSASATQGIAVDSTDSETFILVTPSTVDVLDSHTGGVITSGILVGSNVTSLAFDQADDQLYAAGDDVVLVDGDALTVDGGAAPFGGPHHVLAEAYDPSREVVDIASTGELTSRQGLVTAIDGSSVSSSELSWVQIPVGEDPVGLAVVPPGRGGSGLAETWVTNEVSGTISVISTPPEVSSFFVTPSIIDVGHAASISVITSGGAGELTYDFSGLPAGCSSLDSSSWNCTPEEAGVFQVSVNLSDSLGVSVGANTTFTVLQSLVLRTTFAPSTLPEVDVGVAFRGSATASNGLPPYSFEWSFGDGTGATGPNVSHVYLTPGDYVASTEVRDATGASSNSSIPILVVPRPTAGIISVPGNATDVDFPVSLSTLITGGVGISGETWLFGDGTEAHGANVTHAWTRAGNYTVAFHFTDALGVEANATLNVTVHASLAGQFSSGNVSSSTPALPGSPVAFSSSISGGTAPYSVNWSFGDGSMATGRSVSHSYASAGSYTVAVTVKDAVGATIESNLTVSVQPGSSTGSGITSVGGGFGAGLFLGLILGGVLAAIVLFVARPRKGERPPATPGSPYVPP